MSGWSLVFVCAPLFLLSVFVVGVIFRRRRTAPVYRPLLFTGCMVLCAQLAYMLELLVRDEGLFRYVYSLAIPFNAFAALGALLVVVRFYGLDSYLSRGVVAMMTVLPLITALLAFSGDPLRLLLRRLDIITLEPVYRVEHIPGVWFWAHLIYCYLLMGIALFQALNQHLLLPKRFRVGSALMIASLLLTASASIISNFVLGNSPLSISIVGTCIALVLLYVAMSNDQHMDYVLLARSRIFHHMDIAVFILDKQRRIVECNRAAADCLELWTGRREAASMEDVQRLLEESGAAYHPAVEGAGGYDLHLNSAAANRVYHLREERILDKGGRLLGSIFSSTDVTQNRRLIRWLEQTAGTDALTGLPNRSSLLLRQAGFEADDALPLSVLVGDVNGLKEVNDSLGHRYGDQLIKVIGEALERCCPPEGAVFRTGGDEFMLLLPRTGEEEARAVMDAIHHALASVAGYPFQPSIALGLASRDSQARSLDELMHDADQNMYGNKRGGR